MSFVYRIATVQSDVNCTSQWVRHNNTFIYDDTAQPYASTLEECQKACEFDPRCVAVDWNSIKSTCHLNTTTNHEHQGHSGGDDRWDHFDLVSRCNITSGQCFDSHIVVDTNITALLVKT